MQEVTWQSIWQQAFVNELEDFIAHGLAFLPSGTLIRIAFGSQAVTGDPQERLWAVAGLVERISENGWSILKGINEEDLFEGIWCGWNSLRPQKREYSGGKFPHLTSNQLYSLMNPTQRAVIARFLEDGFFSFDDNLEEAANKWAQAIIIN